MSDPVSALGGTTFVGFASVREIGPSGMITLRAKGVQDLEKAVKSVTGTALPAQRKIVTKGDFACGWMSPDEYLLILPYAKVGAALTAIGKALQGQHHLAADVSDARAVFRVEGPLASDVLRKLCPADIERLEPGELRRTRAAQVAAAVWHQNDGFTVVCFRSVASYMMGLLSHSAMEKGELSRT